MSPHGEASVLTAADGTSFAVGFTSAGGIEALLVTTGKAEGQMLTLRGTTVALKYLTDGASPTAVVQDDVTIVGKQTISLRAGNLILTVTARR